jgi:hypothetical protein
MLTVPEKIEIKQLKKDCLVNNQPKPNADPVKLARLKTLIDKASEKPPIPPPGDKVVYSFPTKSRCPRCQSTDVKVVSTQGNVRYCKCQMPVCHWNFSVIGTKV